MRGVKLTFLSCAVSLDSGRASVHIKEGTKLARARTGNKGVVKSAVDALETAQAEGDKAAAAAVITDVAATQGTYYHKTGPVPSTTVRQTKEDLSSFAGELGADVAQNAPKSVPKEALQVYHDALVKNAVKLAVNKVSELRHKKHAVEKLEQSSNAVPALPTEKLLEDEVEAAKAVRDDTVKQMGSGGE